jgi:enoyl-[acyl-carrier-protein] reductase (NADH)
MTGKRGLIMGLANDRSLAWGIARSVAKQGAELAFSYQGEALEKRVRPLAAELGSDLLVDCDVSDMKALDKTFDALKERWQTLDFVVHAIGYSDKNELRGKFVDTSMDNFLMTMNISVYSFVAVAQRARALMGAGGSILTLTYYGAEKVIPHYNVMGVAKAGLEASVKYLAADLGPELRSKRAHPFLKRFALIRKSELRALPCDRSGDAPRKRAIVGETHDQAALAPHQIRQSCGPPVSSTGFTSSPGCGSSTSSSSVYGPV